jgi:hypothetical protein
MLALTFQAAPGRAEADAIDEDSMDMEEAFASPSESDLDPHALLLDRVLEEVDSESFAACTARGEVRLNEVCAVGTECDQDVRISDYVELYNPGPEETDLGCFALSARDFEPTVLRGLLAPGGLQAFGESELGFRIAKDGDFVALHRLTLDDVGRPSLTEIERVELDEGAAHRYRWPDGGGWRSYTAAEAESGWPGTFGKTNHSMVDTSASDEDTAQAVDE